MGPFHRPCALAPHTLDDPSHPTPSISTPDHEYIEVNETSVVDPVFLDNTYNLATQVVAAVRAASPQAPLPVWAGEIGPHNGQGTTSANSRCADNRVCGRFGSALWYADALGAKAKAG